VRAQAELFIFYLVALLKSILHPFSL